MRLCRFASMTFGIVLAVSVCGVTNFLGNLSMQPIISYWEAAVVTGISATGFGMIFNVPRRSLPIVALLGFLGMCLRNFIAFRPRSRAHFGFFGRCDTHFFVGCALCTRGEKSESRPNDSGGDSDGTGNIDVSWHFWFRASRNRRRRVHGGFQQLAQCGADCPLSFDRSSHTEYLCSPLDCKKTPRRAQCACCRTAETREIRRFGRF